MEMMHGHTLPYAYMTLGDLFFVETGSGFAVNICQVCTSLFPIQSQPKWRVGRISVWQWLAMAGIWDWKIQSMFPVSQLPCHNFACAAVHYYLHMTTCLRWNLGLTDLQQLEMWFTCGYAVRCGYMFNVCVYISDHWRAHVIWPSCWTPLIIAHMLLHPWKFSSGHTDCDRSIYCI